MRGKTRTMPTKQPPWGLTGYFLDPDLFRLLAHSARLQLPGQPLHIPRWRQVGCLTFHMQLSHVLRVGHLQPFKAWRSLLYPSPARLPMCWGVTELPLPMPHDLPSPELTATARWLVRGLITVGADPANLPQPGEGGRLSIEGPPPAWSSSRTGCLPTRWPTAVTFTSSPWPPGYSSPSSRARLD